MSERPEKRRRRAAEKDDDEYQLENPPASSRRKSTRKPKEKKPFDPGASPTLSATSPPSTSSQATATITTPPVPLTKLPIISLYNPSDSLEDDMKECADLLAQFMETPAAEPFLEPVDYLTLELYHYPNVVKNPMDLGSVKKMLQHGTLENPGHFADHVRLVFRNAIEFNQPGSGIYNDAETLLVSFNTEFQKLLDKWALESINSDPKEEERREAENEEREKLEIQNLEENLNTIKATITSTKKQIEKLKKEKKKPSAKLKKVKLTSPKQPLTYEQKAELCKAITDLSNEHLLGLVRIIQKADSGTRLEIDHDEFEIDVDRIDYMTLLTVQKYVKKCTSKRKKVSSTKSSGKSRSSSRGSSSSKTAAAAPSSSTEATAAKAPASTARTAPPAAASPVQQLDTERLALAESQTSQRVSDIEKALQNFNSKSGLT